MAAGTRESPNRAPRLIPVRPRSLSLDAYRGVVGQGLLAKIEREAHELQGLRVVHVNATPAGGGVAEILRTLVPLTRSVGVDAHWYTLPPDDAFFEVTKRIHNWLQGRRGRFPYCDREVFLHYSEQVAAEARRLRADVWVVHDPQPIALRTLVPLHGRAIWRCHIDCSAPNPRIRQLLIPHVRAYDRAVFTMPAFRLNGLPRNQV